MLQEQYSLTAYSTHNGLRDMFSVSNVCFKQGRRTMVTWSHYPHSGTQDTAGLLLLKEKPWIWQNYLLPNLFFYCIIPERIVALKQNFNCCMAAVCSKQAMKFSSFLTSAERRRTEEKKFGNLGPAPRNKFEFAFLHSKVYPGSYFPGRKQGQREGVAGTLQCQWGQTSCWASLCSLALSWASPVVRKLSVGLLV